MRRWFGTDVLAVCLLLGLPLLAVAGPGDCRVVEGGAIQVLEDPGGELTVEQVSRLPAERFQALPPGGFPRMFSRSAFWLRLAPLASGDAPCGVWLSVGEPRLERVQVYLRQGDGWLEMRAGSDYPLEEWAVRNRQPLFPLLLDEGQWSEVLVRVASRSLLGVEPRLHSGLEQLQIGEHVSLVNGVVLGIILLIAPFGLIVGLQIRSTLLLTNALSSLVYMLLTCVVNGYLFHWPALMPWSRELVSVLSSGTVLLFSLYLGALFQVRQLPWIWSGLLILYSLAVGGLLLAGALFDFVGTRILFGSLRWFFYLLVPLLCLAAWWHGLRLSWLAWALTAVLVVQGAVLLLFGGQTSSWQYGEDQLDLTSGLMGVLLLFGTLITEFSRSRRNERLATGELEDQRKAEQVRLESTVARRTEQLRESLLARSALLARISHDLRSPLTGIIEYARLLKTEDRQDYPQRIERNARLQLELIDELLEFSRSELHQQELVLAPGYLYGFLREIEDEARFLAQRRGNRFLCRFADDLPLLVRADFRQVRRVLINLLGNAVKFTREGVIALKVENIGQDGQLFALRFTVEDSGVGLPQEARERLLKPYQRGSNASGVEGFGLGLSIVADLLRQMGSELRFEDGAVGGSVFGFVLQVESASEDKVETVFREGYAVAPEGEGRRIMLVDDVELTRTFFGDLLAGYGHDVMLAGSAEEALAQLAREPADLLIADQFMPGMDGWALLREVRRCRPGLPVLLYSASPARPGADSAGLRFDAELLKPANTEELLACIERLCAARPGAPALPL